MTSILTQGDFLAWLASSCGYSHVRALPGGRWGATYRFAYSDAVIAGVMGQKRGYARRWDFPTPGEALAALDAWTRGGAVGAPAWPAPTAASRPARNNYKSRIIISA